MRRLLLKNCFVNFLGSCFLQMFGFLIVISSCFEFYNNNHNHKSAEVLAYLLYIAFMVIKGYSNILILDLLETIVHFQDYFICWKDFQIMFLLV